MATHTQEHFAQARTHTHTHTHTHTLCNEKCGTPLLTAESRCWCGKPLMIAESRCCWMRKAAVVCGKPLIIAQLANPNHTTATTTTQLHDSKLMTPTGHDSSLKHKPQNNMTPQTQQLWPPTASMIAVRLVSTGTQQLNFFGLLNKVR